MKPTRKDYQEALDLFLDWFESANQHGQLRDANKLVRATVKAYRIRQASTRKTP